MVHERRKAVRPAVQDLLGVLDRSIIVDPERFIDLLQGLLDVRASVPVTASLILARPPAAAIEARDLVSALLIADLRSVDVMTWFGPDAVAILLDADAADALLVARRLQRLLGRSFRARPSWIGVTTAGGPASTAPAMVGAASVALRRARAWPDGAIEVVPS